MAITATLVKELREKTGLPMMDCKKALTESNGDLDAAIETMRKKGQVKVTKLAGRETSQGRVACYIDTERNVGVLVQVRCETAPVANTDDFIRLTDLLARHAAVAEAPTPESLPNEPFLDDPSKKLGDVLGEIYNRLRENIQVARVGKLSGSLGFYIHHNGQNGVLVEMSGDCPQEVRTDVCMHIAFSDPSAIRREQIDAALVKKQREIVAESVKDKPANIIDKIVEGKINKWYGEIVLLEQAFVKDDKTTVGKMLHAAVSGLTVNKFLRYQVGG